jgi:hypothetical protein
MLFLFLQPRSRLNLAGHDRLQGSSLLRQSMEVVPKLQFWGDKLCLSSNLRFNRKSSFLDRFFESQFQNSLVFWNGLNGLVRRHEPSVHCWLSIG